MGPGTILWQFQIWLGLSYLIENKSGLIDIDLRRCVKFNVADCSTDLFIYHDPILSTLFTLVSSEKNMVY